MTRTLTALLIVRKTPIIRISFRQTGPINQIRLPTKLVLSASCVASSWLSPVVRAAQPNQEKKMTNES